MKCFECKKEISPDYQGVHIGDGDFVHENCLKEFEKNRKEFFDNIGDDEWYDDWMKK